MDILVRYFYKIKPQKDCDVVDKLVSYYTVVLLSICSIIIFGWSLFGSPIQCWFPAQFRGWWMQYALDYCYVQNTYFVKFHEGNPQNHWELDNQRIELPYGTEDRKSRTIGYYQWVPFILALMAIIFYIPMLFWRIMYEHSGISVKMILEQTGGRRALDTSNRKAMAKKISLFLDQKKRVTERFRRTVIAGRYVAFLYLFVKAIQCALCVSQFFVLQRFLGVQNMWWGITILNDLCHGREWTETGNFPRVTMCDFEVHELGTVHHNTVQCVLLINMINEKIFVFLWFWILGLVILSFFSLICWAFHFFMPNSERNFVSNYVLHVDPSASKIRNMNKMIDQFIRTTLKQDGIFLLRLIAHNSGDLMCADLLAIMWFSFKEKAQKMDFEMPSKENDTAKVNMVRRDLHAADTMPRSRNIPSNGYSMPTIQPDNQYPTLPSYDDVDKLKRTAPLPPQPAPPPPHLAPDPQA